MENSEKPSQEGKKKLSKKSKILWGIFGAFFFFFILLPLAFSPWTEKTNNQSNETTEVTDNQAKQEEVKDYSMYTAAAQKMCANFLGEKIAPSVPKFPRRTAKVIYQKKDAYRYLVKGTYELSSGSREYTYYCDVLCNDNCKGEYARVNPAHWTLNALEANKESNQSSSLENSWAKDASSEKVIFDDGSIKTQLGKDDYSIDAVNACQTLTLNGVGFVQSGTPLRSSLIKITSGANLFKNTSGLTKFTKWDSFFEEEAFLNASPEKKGKNRYIVEDTFVLYNPMEDKVVDGSPQYSLYCDITYTGKEDEMYSLDNWKINSLKVSK